MEKSNPLDSRAFLIGVAVSVLLSVPAPAQELRKFNLWAASCPHVTVDSVYGVEPLRLAFRQSAGFWSFLPQTELRLGRIAPAFDWDIMINVGDFTSSQFPPRDGEGLVLVDQYRTLTKHYREDIYTVSGNHDSGYYDEGPGSWFRKWSDPMGENTELSGVDPELRRFPVHGTWERYKFEAGNVLFLMMSDRNDAPTPVGRGRSEDRRAGGFPAGAVTRETFEWWKEQVLENQDKIIVTAHHHVLRNTTTRSSYGGGGGLHGRSGDFEGASYLYYIIENDDPTEFEYTSSTPETPGPFEAFLEDFQEKHGKPAIDLWIGGHTHSYPGEIFEGRGLTEERWGVTFLQIAALTHHHTGRVPMSRLLSFTSGSSALEIGLYVHLAPYYSHIPAAILEEHGVELGAPKVPEGGIVDNGWYQPEARTIGLRHGFVAPPPDPRTSSVHPVSIPPN